MRSGRAGRPSMYRGLLMSPEAFRISTYNSPPCTQQEYRFSHFSEEVSVTHVKQVQSH